MKDIGFLSYEGDKMVVQGMPQFKMSLHSGVDTFFHEVHHELYSIHPPFLSKDRWAIVRKDHYFGLDGDVEIVGGSPYRVDAIRQLHALHTTETAYAVDVESAVDPRERVLHRMRELPKLMHILERKTRKELLAKEDKIFLKSFHHVRCDRHTHQRLWRILTKTIKYLNALDKSSPALIPISRGLERMERDVFSLSREVEDERMR